MSNVTQATTYTKIKQSTNADARQFGPLVHQFEIQTSTSNQTVINLSQLVCNVSNKSSVLVILDGQILTEGVGNDYTWTNQGNGLSSQITLASSIPAGLNIQVLKIGSSQQSIPNANSVQADLNNTNLRMDGMVNNKIINGAFDFWQRNTTFAAVANAAYTADRFQYSKNGAMIHTISRSTSVPANSKSAYSMLIDCTTVDAAIAATEFCSIRQKIEGLVLRTFKSKNMVLAFDVRSPKTGVHCVSFRNSAQDRTLVKEYTVNAANTWERKYIRFNHDATGTWLYDTGIGLDVGWTLAAGTSLQTTADTWQSGSFIATANQVNVCDNTSNDFYLADIVLVEDNASLTAQPEYRFCEGSWRQELALSRRYFEKSYEIDTPIATATAVNEIVHWCPTAVSTPHYYRYLEHKRAFPTLAFWSRTAVSGQWVDNSIAARTVDSSAPYMHGMVVFVTPGAINRYVQGHYSAEAEL